MWREGTYTSIVVVHCNIKQELIQGAPVAEWAKASRSWDHWCHTSVTWYHDWAQSVYMCNKKAVFKKQGVVLRMASECNLLCMASK